MSMLKYLWISPPIISGSICSSSLTQSYQLPVLDTMFVRKKHRGKDFGLIMLEDFVDSFTEDTLGLRYPLSSFMYIGKLFDLFFWSSLCFLYMSKWVLLFKLHVCDCILIFCVKCSALQWKLIILICWRWWSISWLDFNPLCEVRLLDVCWLLLLCSLPLYFPPPPTAIFPPSSKHPDQAEVFMCMIS